MKKKGRRRRRGVRQRRRGGGRGVAAVDMVCGPQSQKDFIFCPISKTVSQLLRSFLKMGCHSRIASEFPGLKSFIEVHKKEIECLFTDSIERIQSQQDNCRKSSEVPFNHKILSIFGCSFHILTALVARKFFLTLNKLFLCKVYP